MSGGRAARVAALLAAGLIGGCAAEPAPTGPLPEVFARTQVFCYRSLADVVCHPTPLAGEAGRFSGVGWSGPLLLPVVPVTPGPRTGPS